MLFFGVSLTAGVLATLIAQKMDIECLNAERPRRAAPRRKFKPAASGQPQLAGRA